MNANEVIANRAIELMGGVIGVEDPVHPNDHVNMGQSSNDVIPTAIHVVGGCRDRTRICCRRCERSRTRRSTTKAQAFDGIIKSGRTHLMDATPVRLGQEFGGYASQVEHGDRARRARPATCSSSWRSAAPPSARASTARSEFPGNAHRADLPKTTGLAIPRSGRPLRGAGRARTPSWKRRGAAQRDRGEPASSRERHSLARLGTARGLAEIMLPAIAARQLDHAGQGEPGDVRER